MVSYLESENLLSSYQSGFRSGFSTLTQLINDLALIIMHRRWVYWPRWSFQTITYGKLSLKLRVYDIHGPLYNWITSFLADRLQFVSINSLSSTLKPCTSGSHMKVSLVPYFSFLYINDLPESVKHSSVFLHADDAKILKTYQPPSRPFTASARPLCYCCLVRHLATIT